MTYGDVSIVVGVVAALLGVVWLLLVIIDLRRRLEALEQQIIADRERTHRAIVSAHLGTHQECARDT